MDGSTWSAGMCSRSGQWKEDESNWQLVTSTRTHLRLVHVDGLLHGVRVQVEQVPVARAREVQRVVRPPAEDAGALGQREEGVQRGGVDGVEAAEPEAQREQHERGVLPVAPPRQHAVHVVDDQHVVHGHVHAQRRVPVRAAQLAQHLRDRVRPEPVGDRLALGHAHQRDLVDAERSRAVVRELPQQLVHDLGAAQLDCGSVQMAKDPHFSPSHCGSGPTMTRSMHCAMSICPQRSMQPQPWSLVGPESAEEVEACSADLNRAPIWARSASKRAAMRDATRVRTRNVPMGGKFLRYVSQARERWNWCRRT